MSDVEWICHWSEFEPFHWELKINKIPCCCSEIIIYSMEPDEHCASLFFLEFVFPIVLTFCKCLNKNTNANSAFLFIFCLFNLTQHHPPHSLGAYLSPFHSPLCRSTICIVIKLRNHFIIYLHFNLQLFCIYAVLMLSKFYGNFIYYSFSVYILNIIHRMAKHGMHIREDTGTSRKY